MTFRKNTKLGILALFIAIIGFMSIYLKNMHEPRGIQAMMPGSSVISISASYPKYHPNLESMYEDADIVVFGKVENVIPSWKNKDGLVFTDSEFKVAKYYKNAQKTENIVIRQDGGTIDGLEYRNEDIPLFNEKEEYVLFLGDIGNNRYAIISPVTFYKVENGQGKHKEEARNKSLEELEKHIEKIKK